MPNDPYMSDVIGVHGLQILGAIFETGRFSTADHHNQRLRPLPKDACRFSSVVADGFEQVALAHAVDFQKEEVQSVSGCNAVSVELPVCAVPGRCTRQK